MMDADTALGRVLALWYRIPRWERELSRHWYTEAHLWAQAQARLYAMPISTFVGILSALSPSCEWELNKRDTVDFIESNGTFRCSTYGKNREKARRMLFGTERTVVEELCKPTALKTWNFYNNIVNPLDSQYVTIDRHMARLFGHSGQKGVTPANYRRMATVLMDGADVVRVLPNEFQAVLWEEIKPAFGDWNSNIVRTEAVLWEEMKPAFAEWKSRMMPKSLMTRTRKDQV